MKLPVMPGASVLEADVMMDAAVVGSPGARSRADVPVDWLAKAFVKRLLRPSPAPVSAAS